MGFAPLTQLCELNALCPLLLKSHFNWEATGLPGLSDPPLSRSVLCTHFASSELESVVDSFIEEGGRMPWSGRWLAAGNAVGLPSVFCS